MQPPKPDIVAIAKGLAEANRQLLELLVNVIATQEPEIEPGFIPGPLQRGILNALKNKAMKGPELARKLGGDMRRLHDHPGGMKELRLEGLVAHNDRIGYYRPDAPPPEFDEFKPKK